ncbi:MAG TPA: hypothetical protein DEQ87_07930 [Algoriphagus sp.]|jgi:4-amino-4-deoxy-L-arabinose transferase-like glycosyltransferase|uniref:ArnT family glycosyltransferase n=1 Tax=unclassified Algoriphagus TaxID=2641541 RepID=UPI000C3CFE6C|nr:MULTISPECIES: glycosyltransferase family 39 protein [unclassified Algoriphagus]MAL13627.1 hypothetical protein [Algoriphagus sp.]MAN86102.1 hypothetical protein [Algoriphagus sp.]QYH39957.1 phospholipid carrier-dependent glycosyltransferase [Algoriphagus sp. NBT04N3]HAS58335.1 hypothetical protein [Algoriphagus sp.]HCB46337.1 hypothetical protein [Algoriphagus sp.]|tara:strand:- start:8490 stop:10145 length:1656 start_codon:yes stop_codon:yes gene_type:complete
MLLSPSTELRINPWILMGIFCLLVGPFALDFHMHYPDEIYYRDAAVKMMENGDYLTTYLGSGELRFKKPILTYWAVLAGFKLFGVNAFASRIFFLLAGAATVGLTYKLSIILFEKKKIAGISALIMASNPVLILSASRSIPDVLLVLTMTISAIGFAGYLKYGNQAPKWSPWALYLGLALAFEVKGLPAAALGGIGILYLLINPWQRISWKKLLHLPAILISVFIGLFWFAAMWKIHGPTYLDNFLEDQVGIRVASRIALILKNGLLASFLLVVIFIPWIFFMFPNLKKSAQTCWKENPQFIGFAILWGLAILGMGALTSKFYERYLLPVAPVLAVGIAWLLVEAKFESQRRGLKAGSLAFYSLNLILLVVGAYLAFSGVMPWMQLSLLLLVLLYLGLLLFRGNKLPKVIAFSMMSLFLGISLITSHISFPHQGQQFSQKIKTESKSEVGFLGNLHVGSKIRLMLFPETHLTDLSRTNWAVQFEQYDQVIVEDSYLDSVFYRSGNYSVRDSSVNWNSRAIPELLKNYGKPEFEDLLQEKGKKYYLLEKRNQ